MYVCAGLIHIKFINFVIINYHLYRKRVSGVGLSVVFLESFFSSQALQKFGLQNVCLCLRILTVKKKRKVCFIPDNVKRN